MDADPTGFRFTLVTGFMLLSNESDIAKQFKFKKQTTTFNTHEKIFNKAFVLL